jgi:hypothetical protein
MDAAGSMVVVGGTLTFTLELEDTELVNEEMEEVVYWTNKVFLLAVTLAVNIATVVVLWREDDTPINRLIIWDCMMNIVSMFIIIVPFHIFHNAYLCSIGMFTNITLSIWNRLVPVGIVAFRYMLVCIAVHYCTLK